MPSVNVFSHDTILFHLQACTTRIWNNNIGFNIFRQPWAVQRLKTEEFKLKKQWVKFGKVKYVNVYPLLAGKKKSVACAITSYGLIMNPTIPMIRDRKFILYDNYGVIKLNAKWQKLRHVKVYAVDENKVQFRAPDMPPLTYYKQEFSHQNLIKMDGADMIYNDLFQNLLYLDCGQKTADWFSKYLISENSTVRLAYSPLDEMEFLVAFRDFVNGRFYEAELEPKWNEHLMADALDFVDNIMIKTKVPSSFSDLSEHWSPLTNRPNIVITANSDNAFAQEEWDLLKIGTAVIKNLHPQKMKKPSVISDIATRHLVIGFNCEMLQKGDVRPGDKVYIIRKPDPSLFPE